MSAATAPARDTHMLPSPSAEAPAPPAAQAPTAADADAVNAQGTPFPAGLKVLLVDDDPTCLKVVESMLRRCSYDVTTCNSGTAALAALRGASPPGDAASGGGGGVGDADAGAPPPSPPPTAGCRFDLVLSDVYMPDMDGFKLLEVVGLELDLPVIMMSSNGDTDVVLRGVTHGAVDFLIKPVRLEELRNLWQHVVRRRRELGSSAGGGGSPEGEAAAPTHKRKPAARTASPPAQARGHGGTDASPGGGSAPKKARRMVWTAAMHARFVDAVNALGVDRAAPKRVLEVMAATAAPGGLDGLSRENVASHLQKYRLYLRRLAEGRAAGGLWGTGGDDGGGVQQHPHHMLPPPSYMPAPVLLPPPGAPYGAGAVLVPVPAAAAAAAAHHHQAAAAAGFVYALPPPPSAPEPFDAALVDGGAVDGDMEAVFQTFLRE